MQPPLKLLHLEDDPGDAALIRRWLRAQWADCEIVLVDNKAAFRAALTARPFDVILADYRLPSFDGPSALAMARKLCPEIPFIFLSGAVRDDEAVESLKAGATDYVLKDRPARLAPAIKRALKEAGQQATNREFERRLRGSEAQYRSLLNSIDGIVWQAEWPALRFTFVSQ